MKKSRQTVFGIHAPPPRLTALGLGVVLVPVVLPLIGLFLLF